jgi:phenylalanyl-tRNA synthetase beta chain
VKIVHQWLCDLVEVPADPDAVADAIALRGFEIASVEHGRYPVIDFEVTANRPDCLSHLGFAREASVIWGAPLRPLPVHTDGVGASAGITVEVRAPELCPRYCAQEFEVRVGESPAWLAERLEAAGVRPINTIVDVTNYVMLEIGQPMHAFDHERLHGGLVIRRAEAGERLRTLDGVARILTPDMLVIADHARGVAIAGVMGGADSEIDRTTTRMVLESATFHAPSVRLTSRSLGLRTEASTRFERGADIAAAPAAIARAAALIEQIGAGRAIGPLVDVLATRPQPAPILLRRERIAHLLGLRVADDDIRRILPPLGFGLENGGEGWYVSVPTWRVDVSREADLIEEVGRHVGLDRIPATFPSLDTPQPAPDRRIARERVLRQTLTACGFSEAMTFAFMEREAAKPFCPPGAMPHAIANPLSEKYAVLRPSLLPGLVDACAHNRRRAVKDIRLFETGSRFAPGADEDRAAAVIWCGAGEPSHWSGTGRPVDFFDIKGVAERLGVAFGLPIETVRSERPYLVDGRTAEVRIGAGPAAPLLGVIGQLAPAIADARGFPAGEEIYAAEFDLALLFSGTTGDDLRAEPLPRYPAVVRDVSILVADGLPAAAVRGTIRSAGPPTLVSIVEFDRYSGKGVPPEQISLSLRLTFRAPDRTLTDEEVQTAMEKILAALVAAHGAEQR